MQPLESKNLQPLVSTSIVAFPHLESLTNDHVIEWVRYIVCEFNARCSEPGDKVRAVSCEVEGDNEGGGKICT
jgi:hypothetical protein